MKKLLAFFALTILLSCKEKKSLDGIYEYVPNKENSIGDFEIACSGVGYIELKDGYYYNGITKSTMRFPFKVENDKIVIDNSDGGQLIIDVIDENTIGFMGCLFRKKENETQSVKNTTENTTKKGNDNRINISNKKSEETSLSSLRKFNGEYPSDVKLLSNPILKKRLINLIGKKRYDYMKTTWAVEGSVMVKNDILEAGGCEAHNCNMTNFIMVIDLKKDILYVGFMVEEEIKMFGEMNDFPKQLIDWEQKNIKSKNEMLSN